MQQLHSALRGLMVNPREPLADQLAAPLAAADVPCPDLNALSALMVHAEDTTGSTVWEFGGLNPYGDPDQTHEVAGGKYRVWAYSWVVLVVLDLGAVRLHSLVDLEPEA